MRWVQTNLALSVHTAWSIALTAGDRLTAKDGGAGRGTVDDGDKIVLTFNEMTDRGGQSVGDFMTMQEVDNFLNFSQRIGSHYTGRCVLTDITMPPLWLTRVGSCDVMCVNRTGGRAEQRS